MTTPFDAIGFVARHKSTRRCAPPAIAKASQLVAGGSIQIPNGRPLALEQFAEAMRLANAPGHGGKPLLLLGE